MATLTRTTWYNTGQILLFKWETKTYLNTPLHPLWLQWSLSIACCPWQHLVLLPTIFGGPCTTVLRQMFWGLPGLPLLGGVLNLNATLGIQACPILNTYPSHLKCLNERETKKLVQNVEIAILHWSWNTDDGRCRDARFKSCVPTI